MNGVTPVWISQGNWTKRGKREPWWTATIIRDNYKCRDCGNGHDKLLVHHIDESRITGKLNNELENLVAVCYKCHSKRHGRVKTSPEIAQRLKDLAIDNCLMNGVAQDIAREFGLSRERIRQIANKLGYKTGRNKSNMLTKRFCRQCEKILLPENQTKYCSAECGRKYYKKKYWTTFICKECGKEREIMKSKLRRGRDFCNRKCQGMYIAKTVGFIAHPENSLAGSGSQQVSATEWRERIFGRFGNLEFKTHDFAKSFNYSSYRGGWNALKELVYRDIVLKKENGFYCLVP